MWSEAIAEVIKKVQVGAKIVDICQFGDDFITEECGKVYNKKPVPEKGIAFPTCISANGAVCHFSPEKDDKTVIADGDIIKIDLGVHVDGFIAVAAHTVVAQSSAGPITGEAANVIAACQAAANALLRMVRPGKSNAEIPAVLEKIAESYGCKLVEGVMSHQMKQFVIDGNKVVLTKPSPELRPEECKFEEHEVYAIDVAMTTGEGKTVMKDERQTCVYKRALDQNYQLKMKASRAVFSEINKKYPTMAFNIRGLESKGVRLGLTECLNHELFSTYPVLHTKDGSVAAHFKATVLLMPNGSDPITGWVHTPVQELQPEGKIEDAEVAEILASSYKNKKAKKKKDKA